MIRIVLADDSEVVRDTLASLISEEPDLEVVGTASDVDEAVTLVVHHRPQVAIVDLRMRGGRSNAARAIGRAAPDTHVITLTPESAEMLQIRVGSDEDLAVLPKGISGKPLLEAIRAAANGTPPPQQPLG